MTGVMKRYIIHAPNAELASLGHDCYVRHQEQERGAYVVEYHLHDIHIHWWPIKTGIHVEVSIMEVTL